MALDDLSVDAELGGLRLQRSRPLVESGRVDALVGGDLVEDATWTSLFFAGTVNLTDSFRLNIGGRLRTSRRTVH